MEVGFMQYRTLIFCPMKTVHSPDVWNVVEVALDVPAQRLRHALSERSVRAAPVAEGEAHDLPLGEDGEHDAALHADGDDDHHDGAGELLGRHG